MRIAIDASPLLDAAPTGVGRVVREVIHELARRELPHEIYAVAPDYPARLDLPRDAKTTIRSVALDTAGRRWRGRPAEEFVKDKGIQVFWSTVSAFPRGAACSTVVTVHECPWETPGAAGDEGTGFNHRLWATLDAWFATRVVCPSQSTADAFLNSHLRKSFKSKVVVVPWGLSLAFQSKRDPSDKGPTVLEKFKIRPDYPGFLIVAASRRVKNFDAALRAFKIVRDRYKIDCRLWMAGPTGEEQMRALGYADGLGLRQYVTGLGFMPDADLADLYRHSRATLVLSRSEGFGFPVIESMACGTPVIHSGMGSLAEVAGDAGIRVPLDDEETIAETMVQIHTDEARRTALAEKGFVQAAKYRWAATTDKLLQIFEEVSGDLGGDGHGVHGAAHAPGAHH
ncbi:MAG: glycosyltransferase family 4 protein [Planctomycetes bacterium]|nr:glycosyltransferase family 4 protein [Planctomycetota bacterium]